MIRQIFQATLFILVYTQAAFAGTASELLCQGSNSCPTGPRNAESALEGRVGTITDILLYLSGALAVLVIIVGGIRYITSTGDAARIKAAKDTIFFGIAGLIIAILAVAIVRFIANRLGAL